MAYASTLDAVVLHTHDVGEADRYCILLTRERGKIAARARGARRLGSRLGGGLLPLSRLRVEVKETDVGYLIAGVHRETTRNGGFSIPAFLYAEQATEILLSVLEDGEPLPEVFDTFVSFLIYLQTDLEHPVLPFTVRLLKHLGLFPDFSHPRIASLTENQRTYMERSASGEWDNLPSLSGTEIPRCTELVGEFLGEHLGRPLKAGIVTAAVLQT